MFLLIEYSDSFEFVMTPAGREHLRHFLLNQDQALRGLNFKASRSIISLCLPRFDQCLQPELRSCASRIPPRKRR